MGALQKRVVTGVLAVALAFAVMACDSEDDPAGTTSSGDTVTTEPLGS